MRISIISFTERGNALAVQIKRKLAEYCKFSKSENALQEGHGAEVCADLYCKRRERVQKEMAAQISGNKMAEDADEAGELAESKWIDCSLQQWTREQFAMGRPMVFIGACGIAVRSVAPHLKSKLTDSPVLVIDEAGKYVIPVLSGHVGGANALAKLLAQLLDAEAVITTATDVRGCFAVDLFAKENRLRILKKNQIAAISGKLLDGGKVTVAVEGIGIAYSESEEQPIDAETNDKEDQEREKTVISGEVILPEGLLLKAYPPLGQTDIIVSREDAVLENALFPLKPKEYIVGIGCRRGKTAAQLENFLLTQLERVGLSADDLFAFASIDRKKDEEGLCQLAEKYRIPFVTFTADELLHTAGVFHGSAFVEEQMGVDNVCERAALAACRQRRNEIETGTEEEIQSSGALVLDKQAENGITIAIAKRNWNWKELHWKTEDNSRGNAAL